MLTEMCLASDEFDQFAIKAQSSITFCLKELRGLLVFAESTGLPISMYFDEPGSPVVLSVTDSVLEVNFVLATLSDDSNRSQKDSNLSQQNAKRACTPPPPADDFMNDDMDSFLIAMDTSVAPGPTTASPPTPDLPCHVRPDQSYAANHRPRAHSDEEEEEETDDIERQPNKKFRSLFFGSVFPTSSQVTNETLSGQDVLASDSEDDT